jgi:hypothetical protein
MNTNSVATSKAGGALAALGNLKAGLANVKRETHIKGGEPILRMGTDGKFIFGAENIEVEDGSTWAINPLSIQHGWVCWKVIPEGSKESPELLGEEMRGMFDPKPNKDALPDYGHPWNEQITFQLRCISGEDEGEQTIYKTSSQGGKRAALELMDAVGAQLDKDMSKPVPVVELKSDHYKHKQYGKTYFPVFEVVGWVSMDGVEGEPEGDQPEEPKAAEPQQARRTAAKTPEPEPEPEQDAPEPAPAASGERRRRRG